MVVSATVPPVRRAPLILALLAGAVVVGLRALAPAPAEAAPALAQIGDFNRPVYVVAPPRDIHQVFVVERGGTVRLLVDGTLRTRPFLDIRNLVQTGDGREDERGLLSIAFAPDYATSGRFYAYYTSRQPPAQRAGDIVIDEFRRSATDPEVADPATRRTLVAIAHDQYQNHNGGQLAFGPDAMLYAGTGDGGGGGDPLGSGQNVGSQLGKLLRLDVRPGAGLYPADNPFGAAGPSVWSMGLRNPFRFSFDRLSGDLAIGDVGQNEIEEIDFVPRAAGVGPGRQLRLEHPRGLEPLRPGPPGAAGRAALRLRGPGHPAPPLGRLVLDHRRLRGARPGPPRALRPLRLQRLLQGRPLLGRPLGRRRERRRGRGAARAPGSARWARTAAAASTRPPSTGPSTAWRPAAPAPARRPCPTTPAARPGRRGAAPTRRSRASA